MPNLSPPWDRNIYLYTCKYHEISEIHVGKYFGPMEHIEYTIPYWLRETGVSGASWCRANVGSHWCVEPSDLNVGKTGNLDIARIVWLQQPCSYSRNSLIHLLCFALSSWTVFFKSGPWMSLQLGDSIKWKVFPCCSRNKNNKTVWHKVNSRNCPFRRKSDWWKPKPHFFSRWLQELRHLIWCFHVFSKI